jgi:hypothetical protein
MSYGIKAVNKDGVSLIDENSKQVHISKAGSVLPGTLGVTDSTNNSANTGPQARAVVVPGEVGETLVFVRPRATSGNQTAATFSVHMGLVGKGWTSTAATVVGTYWTALSQTKHHSISFSRRCYIWSYFRRFGDGNKKYDRKLLDLHPSSKCFRYC